MRKRNLLVYCLIAAMAAQPAATAWATTVGPNDVLISDDRLSNEGRKTGIETYITGSESTTESVISGSEGGKSTTTETGGKVVGVPDGQSGTGSSTGDGSGYSSDGQNGTDGSGYNSSGGYSSGGSTTGHSSGTKTGGSHAHNGESPTKRAQEIQTLIDNRMKSWMKESLSKNNQSVLKGYYNQNGVYGPAQTTVGTITKTHDELIPTVRDLKDYYETLGYEYITNSTDNLENYLNACKILGEEPMFGLGWNDESLDWANTGDNTAGEDVDQQDFTDDQQTVDPALMNELGLLNYRIQKGIDSIFSVWKDFENNHRQKSTYKVAYSYKPTNDFNKVMGYRPWDTLGAAFQQDWKKMQRYDVNGDGWLNAEDDGFARIETELEGGHFFKTSETTRVKGYLDPQGKWHKGEIPKDAQKSDSSANADNDQNYDDAVEKAGEEAGWSDSSSDDSSYGGNGSADGYGTGDGSGTGNGGGSSDGSGSAGGGWTDGSLGVVDPSVPFSWAEFGGENGAYGTQDDINKLNDRWKQELDNLRKGGYSNASSIQDITGQSMPQILSSVASKWGSTADTMQEDLKRGFRKDLFGGNGFADTTSWGGRFTGMLKFLANSSSSDTYSFTVVDEVVLNGAQEQVLHIDDYTSDKTRYYLEVDGKISNKAADIYTSTHQLIAANLPSGHTYRLIPAQLVKYTAEYTATLIHHEYLIDSTTGVRLASDEQTLTQSEGTVQHTGWLKYNRSEAITVNDDLGKPDSETPMTERLQ